MKFIIAPLIGDVKHDEQTGRNTYCQSKNIDGRIKAVFANVAQCDDKVVFKHKRLFY
jgi:hypothetical protein